MPDNILWALLGGALIGFASSLMLVFNGRVTGISGILNGFLGFSSGEKLWRGLFIAGLVLGGFAMNQWRPALFANATNRTTWMIALAGVIVGFGTVLGSGCTSGHGVCGISRFSVRSIVATLIFMIVGIVTATAFKYWAGF
ncbi:YeeE/YedE family protein [Bdellovibrio sp. 22V]|uniref:YeeE/YedE family protein n=1 Tax=Bdellovibrio sp. 22V TaxID=3044166 RepID=UPI00254312C1|nr:YeeE/YedE family protein [Bdellovibrio sp. 22V]WII71417.1 YeeE/YedE family protein [Bdellovibrio sp. 22V]